VNAAAVDSIDWRARGSWAAQYGPSIGDVHAVRRARITVDHSARRQRIDVAGYITVEAEELASEPGEVACGIPGNRHQGLIREEDRSLGHHVARWERGGCAPIGAHR
jgi:hypothetical protein